MGARTGTGADLARQREVVDAFRTALRAGDFEGLLAVLDPDVVVRIDGAAAAPGAAKVVRGAANWARGAITFAQAARFVQPALVDGGLGLVLAPGGRLQRVLRITFRNEKIVEIEIIADSAHLREIELGVLKN
jgi:RNA polymerase sigma-70 factor (ECF subfamily)